MLSILMSKFNQFFPPGSNDLTKYSNQFYDIVLNSNNGTYATSGNVNSSMLYNMDWQAAMPDQAYHVHVSFVSSSMNLTGAPFAQIQSDFGAGPTTYTSGIANGANTSSFIGFCKASTLANPAYLFADNFTNQPIYLGSRPNNNQFIVNILNNNGVLFTPTSGAMPSYLLILRFIPAIP